MPPRQQQQARKGGIWVWAAALLLVTVAFQFLRGPVLACDGRVLRVAASDSQETEPRVAASEPQETEPAPPLQVASQPPPPRGSHLWPFSWRPKAVKRLSRSDNGDLAVVPLSPFHACDNQIQQLTCLQTIRWHPSSSSEEPTFPVRVAVDLVEAVCQSLPSAEQTHVMVCLQTHDFLGVLVHAKEDGSFRVVYPAEAKPLVSLWNEPTPRKPLFRLIHRKVVPMSGMYKPRAREPDMAREADDNSGNFLWQYAATRLINPATTLLRSDESTTVVPHADSYIIATANVLNLEQDNLHKSMTNYWQARMRAWRVPVVVLGMGVQAHMLTNDTTSLPPLFDYQATFLREIQDWQRVPAIGTRGGLTTAACEQAGLTHCLPMGCPTLVLSRELNLGQVLARKWNAALEQVRTERGTSKVRIAMALPALNRVKDSANWNLLMDLLMTLHQQHDTAFFISQMPYDGMALLDYRNLHEKDNLKPTVLKKFNNTEQWLDFMMDNVDVVISTRIHGGMAGVSASIPTVVVPTDIRIQELVTAMHLPHLLLSDVQDILQKDDPSSLLLEKVLTTSRFRDLETGFETNRRAKLKAWGDILAEAGLEMDPSLERIVDQGPVVGAESKDASR